MEWAERNSFADCSLAEKGPAGFTLAFPDVQKDRITFCPTWFSVIADPANQPPISKMGKDDIKDGYEMTKFARKAGRLVLHEHLHTWTFNQQPSKSKFVKDTETPTSGMQPLLPLRRGNLQAFFLYFIAEIVRKF